MYLLCLSVKNALKNCVIGFGQKSRFEVIGDSSLKIKPLPLELKEVDVYLARLTRSADGQLMVVLESKYKCYIYKERTWHFHSQLNNLVGMASAHTLDKGTYVFGLGKYQLLKKGTSDWTYQFVKDLGSGIPISKNEIVALKGSFHTLKHKIFKFNFDTNEYEEFFTLKVPRRYPALCIFKGKLFVTGGISSNYSDLKSTEIIPMSGCNESKIVADLNVARSVPGMAVVRLNDHNPTLIAFAGCPDSRVEEWCEEKEQWIFSHLKLSDAEDFMNYCYAYTPLSN